MRAMKEFKRFDAVGNRNQREFDERVSASGGATQNLQLGQTELPSCAGPPSVSWAARSWTACQGQVGAGASLAAQLQGDCWPASH